MFVLTKESLFNVRRLPARLDTNQTALLLGFQPHDIPVLIKEGFLKPLGKPKPNAPKWFAAKAIQAFAESEEELSKATDKITKAWFNRNQNKKTKANTTELTV